MQLQCGLQADVEDSATKVWPSCQKVKYFFQYLEVIVTHDDGHT